MIVRLEGTAVELVEFCNATIEAAIGFMDGFPENTVNEVKDNKGDTKAVFTISNNGKIVPKPYSGGKGCEQEKAEKRKRAKKAEATAKAAKPKKPAARKGGQKPRIISVDEVRESGALECDTIQEAIEAIIELCHCNKASIARLLDIDNVAISSAAKGKVYPYVKNAFRQYLGFYPDSSDETSKEA